MAPQSLARQEARRSIWKEAASTIHRDRRAATGWMAIGRQKARPVRRHQTPALPGPGTTHTERMERPGRTLPQGSRQVLGSDPRPRIVVRDTRGASHAWRAGCGETRTSGSEWGMKKPASATGQGASSLLYRKTRPHSHSRGVAGCPRRRSRQRRQARPQGKAFPSKWPFG